MRCENMFCIYWNKGNCELKGISLDIQGKCQDCIYVDIEENELEIKREKMKCRYKQKLSVE